MASLPDWAPAMGWAVIDPAKGILVRTVSPTRTDALINWLVTEGHMLISQSDHETVIEALWKASRNDCRVERVNISLSEGF